MKSVASIPANYVSILQLQERWMREKEKKGDLVERQVNGQGRREEETMEVPMVKLKETGLRGGFVRSCGVNGWKKEPNFVEIEKVSAIVSNKDENGDSSEKKKKKKKKIVKEMVKCESKVSPKKEKNNNPVKEIATKDSIAEGTQFQDLCIKKRVEEVKGQGYVGKNQRHDDWSSTRVMRATSTTRTMVWVKKGRNDGSARGYGV